MSDANLNVEDIIYYSVQEFYGGLLKNESCADVRNEIYKEAYEIFTNLQFHRGNIAQGIDENIIEFILPLVKGKEIIEVGPGSGVFVNRVISDLKSYSFVEPSRESAEIMLSNSSIIKKIRHHAISSIVNADLPSNSFDTFYCNDVYEHLHVEDAQCMLRRAHNLLRDKGKIIIIASNKHFGPFDGTQKYVGKGAPARGLHINETSYRELCQLLKKTGFNPTWSPLAPISIYNRVARKSEKLAFKALMKPAWIKVIIEEKIKFLGRYFSTQAVIIIAEKNNAVFANT